jgi:hypothetical protein
MQPFQQIAQMWLERDVTMRAPETTGFFEVLEAHAAKRTGAYRGRALGQRFTGLGKKIGEWSIAHGDTRLDPLRKRTTLTQV